MITRIGAIQPPVVARPSVAPAPPLLRASNDDLVHELTGVPQNTDQHVEDLTGVSSDPSDPYA